MVRGTFARGSLDVEKVPADVEAARPQAVVLIGPYSPVGGDRESAVVRAETSGDFRGRRLIRHWSLARFFARSTRSTEYDAC